MSHINIDVTYVETRDRIELLVNSDADCSAIVVDLTLEESQTLIDNITKAQNDARLAKLRQYHAKSGLR